MIDKKPSVIVLMSTYNGEQYIKEQIESIFNQKGNFNISLLIRDDGSSDNTVMLLDEIMKNELRIKLIKGRNVGVDDSFFKLVEMAPTSDYYAISDQDDIWLPDKIESAINIFEKNKKLLLYGSWSTCVDSDMKEIGKNVILTKPITLYNTMIQNMAGGHTQVFNHDFLELIKKNYVRGKVHFYDAFFVNMAMIYDGFYFDNNSHVKYRIHQNNVMGTGVSFGDWIKRNIKRVKSGQSQLYSAQFDFIAEQFNSILDKEIRNEIKLLQKSRNSFMKRLIYLKKMKFYRQSSKETYIFKMLYLFGGWNSKI